MQALAGISKIHGPIADTTSDLENHPSEFLLKWPEAVVESNEKQHWAHPKEMFDVNLAHSFTKQHDVNSTDLISSPLLIMNFPLCTPNDAIGHRLTPLSHCSAPKIQNSHCFRLLFVRHLHVHPSVHRWPRLSATLDDRWRTNQQTLKQQQQQQTKSTKQWQTKCMPYCTIL